MIFQCKQTLPFWDFHGGTKMGYNVSLYVTDLANTFVWANGMPVQSGYDFPASLTTRLGHAVSLSFDHFLSGVEINTAS